jgi:hypothetical protein
MTWQCLQRWRAGSSDCLAYKDEVARLAACAAVVQCNTFVDQGRKSKVSLRACLPSKPARDAAAKYAIDGGKQTLAWLDRHRTTMSAG